MPTGYADHLLPALRRVVLARETADRSDGQLLTAFVHDRDADAFAVLVRRHGPMVLGVCRRVVGDVHAAEDAFQAVFLVLARRAAVVRPREQVGNWLYGVAYRTAIKARAVLARRRSREKQVETMPEPPAPPTANPWADLHPVIDEELARLPDKLRLPVVLCDLEGRPQRAVARHLGVAPATLATRLAAARRLLAGRLTRRGVTLSGGALAGVLGQRASAAVVAPGLADSAVRAAEAVAAGAGVTGLVSAHAVYLCEGVMRMMLLSKLKAAGASALAVLTLTGGLGFGLVPARAGDGPGAPAAARPAPPAAAPKPAGPVDDATFLRRVCLDLAGALPTPVEMGLFAADGDANKRRKVVDWLLADDAVRAHLARKLGVPAERVRVVWTADTQTGRVHRLAVFRVEKAHDVRVGAVTDLAFSPDRKTLALAVSPDQRSEAKPMALAFSADGKEFAGRYEVNDLLDLTLPSPPPGEKFFFLDLGATADAQLGVSGPGKPVVNENNFWIEPRNHNRYFVADQFAAGSEPPGAGEPKPAQTPGQKAAPAEPKPQTLLYYSIRIADTDEAFLGRVVEQARGTPPTAIEKGYFLEDKDPKKREKLLDLLLKDPAVARKLGDDWKKKMLEPATAAFKFKHQLEYRPVPLEQQPLRVELVFPATPRPDRWDQLVGELIGAKKTDEQVLEAVTLATVGRLPTDGEKRLTLAAASKAGDRKAAWAAVARALAASDEGKKHTGPAIPPAKK